MLTANEKIQRAISYMQLKLHDASIQLLGTGGTHTYLIKLKQDMYQNKEYEILDYKSVFCRINFPGNEIPVMTLGTDVNTTSNNVLHMYDILPITAHFRFEDDVKTGNIILYKIKMGSGAFQVTPLEVLAPVATATQTNVVLQEFNVAPVTNGELLNLTIFKSLVEKFRSEDNW